MYQRGVYGNTMTTNPRALDVAVTVLSSLSDDLRDNIRVREARNSWRSSRGWPPN